MLEPTMPPPIITTSASSIRAPPCAWIKRQGASRRRKPEAYAPEPVLFDVSLCEVFVVLFAGVLDKLFSRLHFREHARVLPRPRICLGVVDDHLVRDVVRVGERVVL